MDDELARVLIGVLHAKDGITQLRDEYLNSIAAELAQAVRDFYGIPEDAPKDLVRTLARVLDDMADPCWWLICKDKDRMVCWACSAEVSEGENETDDQAAMRIEHEEDCPIAKAQAALRAVGEEVE